MINYNKQLLLDGVIETDKTIEEQTLSAITKIIEQRCAKKENLKSLDHNFAMLAQPFLIKECFEIAMSDSILEIPDSYFGKGNYYLGTCNLRRSFATSEKENTTTLYHRDRNLGNFEETDKKLLKVFIYLNDVTIDNGPFTYIIGSHNEVFESTDTQFRLLDKTVEQVFPNRKMEFVGKRGTVLCALTTGLHKGRKVAKGFRDLFTINYVFSREKNSEQFFIKKEWHSHLTEEKKNMCKFLSLC